MAKSRPIPDPEAEWGPDRADVHMHLLRMGPVEASLKRTADKKNVAEDATERTMRKARAEVKQAILTERRRLLVTMSTWGGNLRAAPDEAAVIANIDRIFGLDNLGAFLDPNLFDPATGLLYSTRLALRRAPDGSSVRYDA